MDGADVTLRFIELPGMPGQRTDAIPCEPVCAQGRDGGLRRCDDILDVSSRRSWYRCEEYFTSSDKDTK